MQKNNVDQLATKWDININPFLDKPSVGLSCSWLKVSNLLFWSLQPTQWT